MRSLARLIQNASNLLFSERCQASKGASFPCERCWTRQHTFLMYKVCFNELQHGETGARNLQARTSAEPCKRDQTAKHVPARLRVYILSEKWPRSILIIHTGS